MKKRSAMFNGYVVDNGVKRRMRRDEAIELRRLWWKHADIRTSPKRWGALPMGEDRP